MPLTELTPTERKILSFVHASGAVVDATTAALAGENGISTRSRSNRFGVVLDMLGRSLLRRAAMNGRITITPAGIAAIGKAEKQ